MSRSSAFETNEGDRKTRKIASWTKSRCTTQANESEDIFEVEDVAFPVLEELLKKLKMEHVVWCRDKKNMYYEVIFPVPAGEPCENCLHWLTEMGIGVKMNSIVSVIPTQCTYSGMYGVGATPIKDDLARRLSDVSS